MFVMKGLLYQLQTVLKHLNFDPYIFGRWLIFLKQPYCSRIQIMETLTIVNLSLTSNHAPNKVNVTLT